MVTIGIDPGINGGLTALEDGETILASIPMPTQKLGTKTHLDPRLINDFIFYYTPRVVIIESVHAMPGQGVTSMFNFGYGAGMLEGIISAHVLSYLIIPPQQWMKEIFVGMPKDSNKSSITYCQRMFPQFDWRATKKCKKIHDGMTDSCCMALYGYRILSKIKT